jgi:hypothetical protein
VVQSRYLEVERGEEGFRDWKIIIIIIIIIIIRGTRALTNLGRLSSRRWQSFPTAPDGTGLTCGQHIESHSAPYIMGRKTQDTFF